MIRSEKSHCYGFEGYEVSQSEDPSKIESSSTQLISSEEEAVDLSKKITEILSSKVETHNENFDRKVTLLQLKKVFKAGADSKLTEDGGTKCEFAIARVNMFLEMMANGKITEVYKKSGSEVITGVEIDYFSDIVMREENISSARGELDSFGIGSLDFNDVDEDLFLDAEENPISLYFEV
jgi:hypothetical protein